jgi:hypothetical protein
MKQYIFYALCLCAVSGLILAGLVSCELFAVSIESRISMFEDDLNQPDRSDIYLHFHPDTANRQQIANQTIFVSGPFDYDTYSPFDITITSGPTSISGGQEQVIADFRDRYLTYSDALELIMEQGDDSEDWFIRELQLDINGTYAIKRL